MSPGWLPDSSFCADDDRGSDTSSASFHDQSRRQVDDFPKPRYRKDLAPMMPFDAYPHRGRRPIGPLTGDNCRREYGLRLQRLIGLNKCAIAASAWLTRTITGSC